MTMIQDIKIVVTLLLPVAWYITSALGKADAVTTEILVRANIIATERGILVPKQIAIVRFLGRFSDVLR
jgi:hypothetical protein